MIRIYKPEEGPDVLRTRGRKQRGVMASLYTRFADDYNQGTKTFTFDATIYGHSSVKKMLVEAQHDKCCYCETKVTPVAYGDVEHFRPKGKVAEDDTHPGYYWLAYKWSNLLFACQKCNQRFKRTFFPLRDPLKRARSHYDELSKEEPLLIHPVEENPEQYITFYKQEAIAPKENLRGKTTIDVLCLNRIELLEARLSRYKGLEILYKLVRHSEKHPVPPDILTDAQTGLREATNNHSPYAAMTRSAMAHHFWLNGMASSPTAPTVRRRV